MWYDRPTEVSGAVGLQFLQPFVTGWQPGDGHHHADAGIAGKVAGVLERRDGLVCRGATDVKFPAQFTHGREICPIFELRVKNGLSHCLNDLVANRQVVFELYFQWNHNASSVLAILQHHEFFNLFWDFGPQWHFGQNPQ